MPELRATELPESLPPGRTTLVNLIIAGLFLLAWVALDIHAYVVENPKIRKEVQ